MMTVQSIRTLGNFLLRAFGATYLRDALRLLSPFILLHLQACSDNQFPAIDSRGSVPFVRDARLTPDSINLDTFTPVNGTYTVSLSARIGVTDADGLQDIAEVGADVVRPGTGSVILHASLHDDGNAPDIAPGDGLYSGTIQISLQRPQAGEHQVRIVARDSKGFESNTLSPSLFLLRNNSTPRLDPASLQAPDTVDLPVGGAVLVTMSISATDSDGLGDVRQVYFTNLASSNPALAFILQDDGSANPPIQFSLRSGDILPGDGIFTITIPLVDGQAARRTNRFSFKARDSFGAISDSLVHLLTVR